MIWKDVISYEGLYKITNRGKVYSVKSMKFLKGDVDRYGYLHYVLYNSTGRKHHTAHRLVAIHFIDNPNGLPEVNHKDGNKLNNKVKNLEWVTSQENNDHRFISLGHTYKGENNPSVKLTTIAVIDIKEAISKGEPQHSIAKRFSISRSTISMIAIGRIWSNI